MTLNGEPDSLICLTLITKLNENFRVIRRSAWVPPPGGYFRNFWVGVCRWDPGTLNL